MMRLEDQRLLRDPNPPPPLVLVPATSTQPAVVAPPPPSDLIRLLGDPEARVRRRAALSLGRVGLPAAVEPLAKLLADEEPDVRQMSAFALGLIGSPAARSALLAALRDADPRVQGRAAEALGILGDRADADAVSGMVRTHVAGGALAGLAADDLSYPLAPAAEAARLGLYALVRFGSFDALWDAVFQAERTAGLELVARVVRDSAARRSARRRRARAVVEHAGPLHRCVRSQRARRHEGAGRKRAATSDRRGPHSASCGAHRSRAGARGYWGCRWRCPD